MNETNYHSLGVVQNRDGSVVTAMPEDLLSSTSYAGNVQVTESNLAKVNQLYHLKESCSSMMYKSQQASSSSDSSKSCEEMGPKICEGSDRQMMVEMMRSQERLQKLQTAGDCKFGLPSASQSGDDSSSTCNMLELEPTRTLGFLCGRSEVGDKRYCGDWVTNPDGQCSGHDNYESCSLTNGPVHISEKECAVEPGQTEPSFLKKFTKGPNGYCETLKAGGCCVGSMFFALSDSNDATLWPLCVTTWVTETCGIDLMELCPGTDSQETALVRVTSTIIETRRLSTTGVSKCTSVEAKSLSDKMGRAMTQTSSKAGSANARPIVISDSSCLNAGATDRQVVLDFVVQGDGAADRQQEVLIAVSSPAFQENLRNEGVEATSITTKGSTITGTKDANDLGTKTPINNGDTTSRAHQTVPIAWSIAALMIMRN
jgi:hypothetical protein